MDKETIYNFNNLSLDTYLKEPSWLDLVYSFIPKKLIINSFAIQYKFTSPYEFFLKGVSFEFGVVSKTKDFDLAYENYKIGADRNEPYCNLRLFYLHLNKNNDFAFMERSNDQAIYHLLCAQAFYIEDDEPRFKNIFLPLLSMLEPKNIKKLELLFLKFKDQPNINFVRNFIFYTFCENEDKANSAFINLFDYSDLHKCMESTYFLGLIYNGLNKAYLNSQKANECFEKCVKNRLLKSYFIYCKILWSQGKLNESIDLATKGASRGCYKCCYFLGNQIYIRNGNIGDCLENLIMASYLGHLFSFHQLFFIFTKIVLINKEFEKEKEKYSELIFDFAEGLYTNLKKNILNCEDDIISNGDIYYIYANCYLKAIGTSKNNKKAHEILLEAIKDKNVIEKKNIYKFLIKSSKGVEVDKTKFYFDNYLNSITLLKNKYSQHYYALAKIYSKSNKLVKVDLNLAINYCKQGTKFVTDLMLLIPNFYKKKCEELLKKLISEKKLQTKIDKIKNNDEEQKKKNREVLITEENNCVICLDRPKQVVFIPCGHKCCCNEDGKKLFDKKIACPICNAEITFVLERIYE